MQRITAARRLGGLARAPLREAGRSPRSRDATLVFDLDGTLVETAPDLCGAVNALMRELGRPEVTLAQTKHMVGDGMAKLAERALAAHRASPSRPPHLTAATCRSPVGALPWYKNK